MEGITVDGGGGLRVGAGEEKVRDGVLVLRLTFVGTCSLFMDSDQTFHAIVLEYIRLADRPRFLVDLVAKDHGGGFHWVRMAAEIAVGLRVR